MEDRFDPARDARAQAEENAQRLLQSVLPSCHLASLETKGSVVVTGQRNVYVLSVTSQTEIRDKSDGRLLAHACLQLSIPAPRHDRVVAEYLLLKNNEDLYWRTANIFPCYGPEIAIPLLIIFNAGLFAYVVIEIIRLLKSV